MPPRWAGAPPPASFDVAAVTTSRRTIAYARTDSARTAADCAEELPGAHPEHPFGDDWEVFMVRGKVFMLMAEVPGRPVVILKAEPGEAVALRDQNSHITPGYHMNKKHWITLEGGDSIDKPLVRELVTESYRLVVAHLPKAEQPVDPDTYAGGTRAFR